MIYFVQFGDGQPIKIGTAGDVEARIRNMQTHQAYFASRICTMQGDTYEERSMHERFEALRIRGEWFAPLEPLLTFMATLDSRPDLVDAVKRPRRMSDERADAFAKLLAKYNDRPAV
jgi:hypothetical protein